MKTCKVCKNKFEPKFSSVQMVCSSKCAIEYSKNKQKAERLKDKTKLEKARKDLNEAKSYQRVLQDARKYFQQYIRLRDKDKPCISCGNHSKLVDAGHYFKAELYSGLIFNEDNVHSQCRKCNRYLGGNESHYRIGLVNRYGEDFVKSLESIKDRLRVKKFSKQELIEIKNYYKKLVRNINND